MKMPIWSLLQRRVVLVALMLLTVLNSDRRAVAVQALAAQAIAAQPAGVGSDGKGSPQPTSMPWIELFDGETLFGWRGHDSIEATVQDDVLQVQTTGDQLFRTSAQFSDFLLELEVDSRSVADDAAVMLRSSPAPRNPQRDGVEIPLCGYVGLSNPPWQTIEIECVGDRVTFSVNGQRKMMNSPVVPGRGYVGFRSSGKSLNVRNVRLKPLGLKPLIAAGDLGSWQTDQMLDATAQFGDDGTLRLQSGKGQLESRSRFADFVLQVSCRTNTPGMNSGIFFRSIPGEFSNGYESQIQNEFVDGDRTKPKDCGTGGIFRRTDARRVVASDGEWFTKTIVASGNYIGVWVDGIQVTDWSDNRPANANPRRGQRREAGTIILQAHDPTTDISFRQIDVVELRPR